jgi:hypothetical protein
MLAELHQFQQTLAFHAIPSLLLEDLILYRHLLSSSSSIHLMLLRLSLRLWLRLWLRLGLRLNLCLSRSLRHLRLTLPGR